MKSIVNLINLIKICKKHKKTTFVIKNFKKVTKIFKFIKLLINLKVIKFIKVIKQKMLFTTINNKSKIKINMLSTKQIHIKKKNKLQLKNIFIISNDKGFCLTQQKSVKTGLLVARVSN